MLRRLNDFRRSFFDVRPGEFGRTVPVALYLLFVLFAYYILKPVSRALFVNRFDPDKLPGLYILIAPAGGLLAYVYSRLTLKASLTTAVNWATAVAIGFTVLMGYLIKFEWVWTYYVFNIWVSMFSILMVTQGWVIAANVFNTREAKRLYGILGMGAVIGAGFGGTFTSYTAAAIGETNLIYASAGFTLLAYLMYRLVLRQPGVHLETASASQEGEESDFRFGDILRDIRNYRHLQVVVGIVLLMFIVDVTVEYQFQVFAKRRYPTKAELTAFMGAFQGIYLNLFTFTFQFFLTALVIRWFGVGGVLQIMPVAISIASIATFVSPGVVSTGIARLMEAATRYTFNRTGMELLYLPLPLELRNRTKAFLDIFVDRFGRGLGGVFLQVVTVWLAVGPKNLSLLVLIFTGAWILLCWQAQREYLSSVRRRLDSRSLGVGDVRVSVSDPAIVRLLEETARGENPRQAAYAISLLRETPGYDTQALARTLAVSRHAEVRAAVYGIVLESRDESLLPQAMAEIRSSRVGDSSPAIRPAVDYALGVSPEREALIARLLTHPNASVAEAALDAAPQGVVTLDWASQYASSPDAARRRLGAIALSRLGDEGAPLLYSLLADGDQSVAEAALASAGRLKKRANLEHIVRLLGDPRLRHAALASLAAYGPAIAGTLRDLLDDPAWPLQVRRHIPRALEAIGGQRAAEELIAAISLPDLGLRNAVLQSLTRMRRTSPDLYYGPEAVAKQLLEEVKHYFSLWSALEPFSNQDRSRAGVRLVASTLEERMSETLDRVFHLLGLKYSAEEMHSVRRALDKKSPEDHSAAIEFLDSVLDRELKVYLMPLVDDTGRLSERGRELFGIERKSAESALRELLRSGDAWLTCCAIAAARELRMASLIPEMESLRGRAGAEVDRMVESYA
ncbi:MAG: Npt1/Npt2 family nucleotide transporter [Bryobacteraceae bacterium]|nr:Npt1/Npt2 family nucleotide transporter [Bryobacteraceae bacterium]